MSNTSTFKNRLIGEQGNMMNFAYKLTSDHSAASDLVQEATLKALDNEDKYADNVNFKGWIFTIMRNIFINNYRRNVRQNTMVDTTANLYHLNSTVEATNDTPDGALTLSEISGFLNELPENFSKPFSMHMSGYKYEEIANHLHLPLGTVKSRIFTTRRQLRSLLSDYND
jgi:RNA polymerase sigma-70 factor (ECF subfamily)